jgi:altronate hydrolase
MDIIKINPLDNVMVALTALNAGMELENGVTLTEPIAQGHKVAIVDIKQGENIIKYGNPIGHATADIKAGSHVHVHNVKTNLSGTVEYAYKPMPSPEMSTRIINVPMFQGYRRRNGEVGIRNELWIIPTVGCVNETARRICTEAQAKFAGRTFDGVYTFAHPYGCSQMGDDQGTTQTILADLVRHPNAGAVLVLGLGCENNNINAFHKVLGDYDQSRVRFLVAQDTDDELAAALRILDDLTSIIQEDKREAIPVSELKIGLKCGGSDGLSGITANPLLGAFSDRLVVMGGTTILTEVPEMFGAETLLMDRSPSEEIFNQTVAMINGFKDYYTRHDQVIYENPSPGNKDGGITTLEDKSLGCVQKGGSSAVCGVLAYGEQLARNSSGLNLLEGPGNDIVAVSALAAAKVHIVLFTTGRGTPLGAPVPVVKVSTNSALAKRKASWIDFDAGVLVDGVSMDDCADALFKYVISVASGTQTQSEKHGYRDMAIFKDGVTL